MTAKPHAQVFDGEPKAIRLALGAGDAIAPHHHPDREIVAHVLEGRLSATIGDDAYELVAGDVARFDGAYDIAPEALDGTTALLVLAPRAEWSVDR